MKLYPSAIRSTKATAVSHNAAKTAIESKAPSLWTPVSVLQLQRTVGNRAVSQMLQHHQQSVRNRSAASVIQRLKDKDGVQITAELITAETNIDTLKSWFQLENEDWDTEEEDNALEDMIAKRISELDSAKAAIMTDKEKSGLESKVGRELPNFDKSVSDLIKGIRLDQKAKFFAVCLQDDVEPSIIANGIVAAAGSPRAANKGLAAFAEGANFGSCMRLASTYESLMSLTMDTIQANEIVALLGEGFLKVEKDTYCDTPLKSGSVYVFKIAMTGERLRPEWHVHWGPQNHIEAASFKDKRMAHGPGARVTTEGAVNEALKNALKSVWGP